MRKPLHYLGKRFLRFSSKPLLTLSFLLLLAGASLAQTGTIINPCVCLSNASCPLDGQFTSTLQITNGGAGPWYVVQDSVNGFFVSPSPAPPAQPIEFITGAGGINFINISAGTFELTGIHVDGKDFRLRATDGNTTVLFVSAGCSYPHTRIIGDPFVCEGKDTFYTTALNAGSTYVWTLDHGGTISSISPVNRAYVSWDPSSNGQVHHLSVIETSALGCIESEVLDVEIEDTITMACNNNVQISLDANCAGELTADMFLEGTRYDNESYSLKIQDAQGNVINPAILSDNMIGKTYMVTVKHLCSGNSCWSNMIVMDKTAPELLCHTDTIKCSASIYPLDMPHIVPLVHYTSIQITSNPYVFIAKGSNGCSDVTLKYYDNVITEDCNSEFTSTIIRTWLALDQSGNFTSCIDTIRTTRTGMEDIIYPKNWDGLPGNQPFIQACSIYKKDNNGNPHPDLTGQPDGPLCGNIMVNYSDKRLYLCQPDDHSYKVLRHWIVMDNCTGESYDTLQIIAIMDTQNPKVTIPGLVNGVLIVNTGDYDCGSDVVLPVPVISDCSSTSYKVKYQVADDSGNFPPSNIPYLSVPFVGGKYKIPDIPAGLARVKYIVEDACGNTTEKIVTITVTDNLPPQAICDAHTSITLNENGLGYLGKMTFDDGSYDNCTAVTFRVRRTISTCDPADTQWGDGINFCCADVAAGPVMVELEVTDENGFKNSCMAQVFVNDKELPKISCPPNGEVSCKFDYSNLNVFGTVRTNINEVEKIYITDPENGGYRYFGLDGYATDNCNVIIEPLTPTVSINNCGIGTITRRFRAKDNQGNLSNICSQMIQVTDFRPFTPNADIDWPDDYNVTGCLSEALLPDNLPERFGWPKLLGEDRCSMVAMDYDDLVFEHIDGMCYKILRKWRVVDWCQYNQNDPINSSGYWEYTQNLFVNDNVDPVVTSGCQPLSIVAAGDCVYRVTFTAAGTDNCTASEHLAWSYKLQRNNSPVDFVTGNTKEFSIDLSKGIHRITWSATDHCGNVGQCTQTFTIVDNKKPTPQCIEGLVTVLLPVTGEVTINASSFNVHSFDDCTRSNYGSCGCLTDLKFSFSPNTNNKTRLLTCADIADGKKDTIELEMWVTDESGNQDFCKTFIILQDNSNVCPDYIPPHDTIFYNLNGLVRKPNNQPVGEVNIVLSNESTEFMQSFKTNDQGKFGFSNLADNYNYYLESDKSGDDPNGLSTLDIVLIQKHILNIKKLDSPYKLIAADVNNSGSVSAGDILELRKIVLGESNTFKSNVSWRFIDSGIKLNESSNLKDISSRIEIGNQVENIEKSYTAIKIGDVNYSAITNQSGNLAPRSISTTELIAEDRAYNPGENISLEIRALNDISFIGTQFTLEFDASRLVYTGFESDILNISENNINAHNAHNGIVTISLDETNMKKIESDEILFTLKFTSISYGSLSQNIQLCSKVTRAEIYELQGAGIEEKPLKLRFDNDKLNFSFEVYQNTPNPFSEKTIIAYVLPEADLSTLTVFDLSGKKIYHASKEASKGYNEFEINNKDLDVEGMLYYKLESGQYSEMKKMILIR